MRVRKAEPERAVGDRAPGSHWLGWILLAASLAALPVAVASIPPVLDLPQLVAQVDLGAQVLAGEAPELRIQWWSPNKIGYLPIALGVSLAGPDLGARIGLGLSIALAVAGIFGLARRVGSTPEHALLATVFVLARPLHTGLLNFVVGSIPFLLFAAELVEEVPRSGRSRALRSFLWSGALYLSHVLLLAGAFALSLVALAAGKGRRRALAWQIAGIVPWLGAGAAWYWSLGGEGWRSGARWIHGPLERLAEPQVVRFHLLGVLQGAVEPAILVLLALWVLLCVVGVRRVHWRIEARRLAFLALVVLAGALLALPEGYGDTVYFSHRWGPLGAMMLLLSLPPLSIAPRGARLFGAGVLLAWSVAVAAAWHGFARDEMRGFRAAVAAVPPGSRLLALDYLQISPRFYFLPTFQMGAWAATWRHAETASTFADQPTSPVVFRRLPRPIPWTRRLENYPLALRARDLDFFDRVLVHGDPPTIERRLGHYALRPVAGEGVWWLLRKESVPSRAQPR